MSFLVITESGFFISKEVTDEIKEEFHEGICEIVDMKEKTYCSGTGEWADIERYTPYVGTYDD
jgi:hypothetical protein